MDTQDEQVEKDEVETEQVNEEETPKEDAQASVDEGAISIPDNWESDVKDFINSIQDQAGKKAVFDKLSNYDKGYQKKFQELASQRKQLDDDRGFLDSYRNFEKTLDPQLKAEILARYSNVPNYMQSLHQMDVLATRDPVQFVRTFCLNNGIKPEQINNALTDNKYQEMQNTRSQDALRAEILEEVRREQQQQRERDEINRFIAETNADGSPKHPLLNDRGFVLDMDKLQKAFPERSLEELYQMTLSTRPEWRENAVKQEVERIEQAKAVNKAKSVIGVQSATPMANAQEKRSWRNQLNDVFE